MKPSKTDIKINLKKKPQDFFGPVFLKWAINIGRVVIVGTELILLGALLYRFNIDKEIINLHDSIKSQSELISFQQKDEKKFRALQAKLSDIKTILEDTDNKMKVLNAVISKVSNDNFVVKRLSLAATTLSVELEASTIFPINQLISDLKKIPEIGTINIDQIAGSDSKIKLTLNIYLKEQ